MRTNQPLKSLLAAWVVGPGIVAAETATAPDQAAELAKKLNNPVADLISVPFKNNFLFNVGPGDGFHEMTNIQPFLAYTTHTHTTFTINSESTYDWMAAQWTMPFNARGSQVLKIGEPPVSIGLMGTWFAGAPSGAPAWGVRLASTFLFPKH